MSKLSFAIPSKGRLKEQAEQWLSGLGFPVSQIGGERGYQAEISGLGDVEMRLLSAREIAQGLIEGSLHAGVTGEDLLHDLAPEASSGLSGSLGLAEQMSSLLFRRPGLTSTQWRTLKLPAQPSGSCITGV